MRFQPISVALLSFALLAAGQGQIGSRRNRTRPLDATAIYQSNFTHGTYRIMTPGYYYLAEDIVFNPNADISSVDPSENFMPLESQFGNSSSEYPRAQFRLGFFAAITVETSRVRIDLNGFKIQQGAEHALMQRSFALIELANSQFIAGQGSFASEFKPASMVQIFDGHIGLSAQYGIHGNQNLRITIDNINFDGFETAAVQLNGVRGLRFRNCVMENRKDVPVLSSFSAARSLQRYVDYLRTSSSQTTLKILGVSHDVSAIQSTLRSAVNRVFDDVVAYGKINQTTHPKEHGLFANEAGLSDRNGYCVVINQNGVVASGFPNQPGRSDPKPSSDVHVANLKCRDHFLHVREVVALKHNGEPINDPAGSIVQLLNKGGCANYLTIDTVDGGNIENAWYTGNALANAQMLVGKAIHNGDFDGSSLDVSRNSVTPEMVAWVEAGALGALGDLAADEGWICNGDSMFHVQEGLVSYKVSSTTRSRFEDVHVDRATNFGDAGARTCGDYTFSHPLANLPGYSGAHARGFSFAGCKNVEVKSCTVNDISSLHGDAIGFDVMTDSEDVLMQEPFVRKVFAREDAIGARCGARTTDCIINDEDIAGVESAKSSGKRIFHA
jgi:hypothetical protein